ncbi:uncharacterized protein ACO6RY_11495 [Pungitius sinensis]
MPRGESSQRDPCVLHEGPISAPCSILLSPQRAPVATEVTISNWAAHERTPSTAVDVVLANTEGPVSFLGILGSWDAFEASHG